MSRTSKVFIVGFVGLISLGVAVLFVQVYETFSVNGFEAFFGQLRLTPESGGLSPRQDATLDILAGRIRLSEITRARLIKLPGDVLFWDPYFVGFPSTELRREDVGSILADLQSANLFASYDGGKTYDCVARDQNGGFQAYSCPEAARLKKRHTEMKFDFGREDRFAELQVGLRDGRKGSIRLFLSAKAVAFTALHPTKGAIDGIAGSCSPFIRSFLDQVRINPIPVEFPGIRSEESLQIAERRLGKVVGRAVEFIRNARRVSEAVGEIRDVRPAKAVNWFSSWMDSTSAHLTFRVVGGNGEAAVLVRGYKEFNGELVFRGRTITIR